MLYFNFFYILFVYYKKHIIDADTNTMKMYASRNGVIDKILVKKGDFVSGEKPLFSMKTKYGEELIDSRGHGIVKEIHVEEGSYFYAYDLLIELDLNKRNSKEDNKRVVSKSRDEENPSKKMKVSIPDKLIDQEVEKL